MSEQVSKDAPRPMVEMCQLGKDYGEFTALHSLSLSIKRGEVFGFLGPNGAGKTTTIRLLTGLLEPTRGDVRVKGMSVHEHPEQTKSMMGYIPDQPFLYDKLTGDEYVAFVAGLWGMEKEDAIAAAKPYLERFKLSQVRSELVEGYSHGMKQKLVMSAAFCHSPELLVVDEPTVGLDPRSVLILKEIFRQLASHGATVFLSTHSLDVAETVCDRIGILHKGRLIAEGTMAQLRERASSDGGNLESVFLTLTEEEEQ